MTINVDPDQLASSEAYWSGSTLFANTGHVVFSKRRVNAQIYKYFEPMFVYKLSKAGPNHSDSYN